MTVTATTKRRVELPVFPALVDDLVADPLPGVQHLHLAGLVADRARAGQASPRLDELDAPALEPLPDPAPQLLAGRRPLGRPAQVQPHEEAVGPSFSFSWS